MVRAGWYATPTAAATYTYVLEKIEGTWVVKTRYMESVT